MASPTPTKLPLSDRSRWVSVYPAYINQKKTVAEGRRICKQHAVDTPTAAEIYDICKSAGLNAELEKMKMYPRDQNRDLHVQGRVKVQLYDDTGAPVNAEACANRKALYLYVAQTIPKLKTRQQQKGGTSVGGGGDSAPAQSTTGKANKKRKGK